MPAFAMGGVDLVVEHSDEPPEAGGDPAYGTDLLDVPAVHRDGHTTSIAFTVSLVFHPGSGELTGIAAVVRDDSERRQERRRVSDELDELRALRHTAPAPGPPVGG